MGPRLSAGQNVLLVAHGNSLWSVIAYVAGLTEEESIRLQLATAAPIMYNYDGEKFSHTNHQSKWKLDKPQFLTSTLKLTTETRSCDHRMQDLSPSCLPRVFFVY